MADAQPTEPLPNHLRVDLINASHSAELFLREWVELVQHCTTFYPAAVPVTPAHLRFCEQVRSELQRINSQLSDPRQPDTYNSVAAL